MSDISKFKVGNDTYNIKDEESRNTMAETVLSTDTVPFVSKTMNAGKYQRKKFVGCSYVWNQLVDIPASDKSKTLNGLTFTDNRDGSYSLQTDENGTTAQSNINMVLISCKANHVYYLTGSDANYFGIYQGNTSQTNSNGLMWKENEDRTRNLTCMVWSGQVITQKHTFFPKVHDLTQLFGSTAIADYIYNLEQATAGAGVAKLKELGFFTEDYYEYDAGSIQSVDIKEYAVGGDGANLFGGKAMIKNALSMNNTNVTINETADTIYFKAANVGGIKLMSFVEWAKPNTQYTFIFTFAKNAGNSASNMRIFYTDNTYTEIPQIPESEFEQNKPATVTVTSEANKTIYALRGNNRSGTTTLYADESGIFAKGTTEFEPYHVSTYSLTPTELRGVPRIDANNNIYCDGDEYASDGTGAINYDIVDMGELTYEYVSESQFMRTTSALSGAATYPTLTIGSLVCPKYMAGSRAQASDTSLDKLVIIDNNARLVVKDSAYTDAAEFKTAMSGVYLVYKKATPTTETLTPFDYPQSVGSLEEIVDYKVEQEDRDVAIPTGHVTEYMGKGGEFTLPTLPETPSVLAFDGHNAYWEENTINLVKAFMNENRRTRRNITNDLANLSQAVAEKNLGKYEYSIGDYFTGASGYTYILADPNTFKGTYTPYCINTDHFGIVVDTHAKSQWNSENMISGGYYSSTLHSYLTTTVLDTIKTDFIALFGGTTGLEHLKAHSKLLTTALANLGWKINQYISALTCTQVDAGSQWTANGYQEGESSKSLELFRKYKWTEIFGSEYSWLRNISNYDDSSASYACYLNHAGDLRGDGDVTRSYYAVGLIIFA